MAVKMLDAEIDSNIKTQARSHVMPRDEQELL
jgi:hypothetical protein